MRKELVMAEKEFRDYVTSKRFLAMFAIMLILAVVGMVSGMDNYNQQLDQYKKTLDRNAKDPYFQQTVESMQKQIQDAEERGAGQDEIDRLKYQLESITSPLMPSIISIYYAMSNPFYMIGMILAVSMGFDLISKEKDEGSLKVLLSHPIYRDAVINGKAIAAIATLGVVLAGTFLITFAILLFNNMVPAGDDLLRMIAIYVVSMFYCIVFLAIAMMISTISKSSSMALLVTLGIVVLLYILPMVSWPLTQIIIGHYPQSPEISYGPDTDPAEVEKIYKQYEEEQKAYNDRMRQCQDIIQGISPQYQYSKLTNVISSRVDPGNLWGMDYMVQMYKNKDMTLWKSLSFEWTAFLIMIVETIVAFSVAYVRFMRMDIR